MPSLSKIFFLCLALLAMSREQVKADPIPVKYPSPFLEHAPLAAFSLGSLAIGTVFYTLGRTMHEPKGGFIGRDQNNLGTAVGAAGFSALIAGVAYFYYAKRDLDRSRDWNAHLSGNLEANGDMQVSADLVLPLSFLKL